MAIHLFTGDDEVLLRAATGELVGKLVGDADRAMMVDEFDGEEYELRAVVDAAQTPPFLTDKRVIVARGVGRFTTEEITGLLAYMQDPLDTSELVLAGGGGRLSQKLSAAVKKLGTVTSTSVGSRDSDREKFVRDQVAASGLRLDGAAQARIADWLGESAGHLEGVLGALGGAYEPEQKLGLAEVEPYLGEAGGLPPWDLTDAIDGGDTTKALTVLHRMLHGGERHPLQLMQSLYRHYGNIAKLDGAGARSEKDAATITGLNPYPAKKALNNYRRLGGEQTRRAIDLLAVADLDLRGDTALEAELVIEVLVARLSKIRH